MTAELVTRLVFVDTSAYEKKNYQFGQHALGRLQELVEDEKIHLLITDVTKQEIEAHLYKNASDAANKVKKLTKEAMFLRNTPDLDCHGIFSDVSSDEIYKVVHNKFIALIENGLVDLISIDTVDPKIVFDAYFKAKPPFEKESKKHEFPDAFALEAIKNISLERQNSVYIVSCDGDMLSFAEKEDKFIPLESVDELIDLVVRHDETLAEPTRFADEIFEGLAAQVIEQVTDYLRDSEFTYENSDPFEDIISSVEIDSVSIAKSNLQEVSNEHAEYEVEFDVTVTAHYSVPDYDRSPWDPEDKQYVFILRNESIVQHKETYSAYISISYEDGVW
ncbi:PIN domain-containing protein [Shewanella marinintestina]|uniref:PIN domain-containing protein n=1 Tax=Shewanella marinintestina TaxID=190305 RepID=UPI00200E180B|nr:PIN domain-containing protein [Shewanella marinintestina]MCL1147985.1 PIN domain-containing protein [Shewanella marinintestina]